MKFEQKRVCLCSLLSIGRTNNNSNNKKGGEEAGPGCLCILALKRGKQAIAHILYNKK